MRLGIAAVRTPDELLVHLMTGPGLHEIARLRAVPPQEALPRVGADLTQTDLRRDAPLFRRLAVPEERLVCVPAHAVPSLVDKAEMVLGLGVALHGRFREPAGGGGRESLYAVPALVGKAEMELGLHIPGLRSAGELFRGFVMPEPFLFPVPGMLAARGVDIGQGTLRRIMPLSGRLKVEAGRLVLILRHALSRGMEPAQTVPGFSVSLCGGLAGPDGRLRRVLPHASAFFIEQAQPPPGLGISLFRRLAVPDGSLRRVPRYAVPLFIRAAKGKPADASCGSASSRGRASAFRAISSSNAFAPGTSCAAALRSQKAASNASCGTPSPSAHMEPSRNCASPLPCPAALPNQMAALILSCALPSPR